MNTNKYFSLFVCAGLLAPFAPARASVDAAQLDIVAIDSLVNCNSLFFQSSRYFKNTIFVVPRVTADPGPRGRRTFDIEPIDETDDEDANEVGQNVGTDPEKDGKPKYYLTLRLYFPRVGERLSIVGASQHTPDLDACNTDYVKHAIEKNSPGEKINVIAGMPLTSVGVDIPNIDDKAEVSKEATVIKYYGQTLEAVFKITSRERKLFLSRTLRPDGLGAKVYLRFSAKGRDGAVHAEFNSDTILGNFYASANIKNKQSIAKAIIETEVRAAMTSDTIKISNEVGRSGSLDGVVNRVLDEMQKALSAVHEAPASNPVQAEDGGEMISVKTVVKVLTTTLSKGVHFEQFATEAANAMVPIKIKQRRIDDPNVDAIEIRAHYGYPSTRYALRKGDVIAISPSYTFVESISYPATETYLTESEIIKLNLAKHFPDIVSHNMRSIKDVEYNNHWVAEGKYQPVKLFGQGILGYTYRWKHIERNPLRKKVESENYDQDWKTLGKIPVAVAFSGLLGRWKYSLQEIAVSQPGMWTSSYDQRTGRIIFKAETDLGILHFKEHMIGDDIRYQPKDDDVVLDAIVQEIYPTLAIGAPQKEVSLPVVLDSDDEAIIRQRTIVINVTRMRNDGSPMPAAPSVPAATSAAPLELRDQQVSDEAEAISIPPPPY